MICAALSGIASWSFIFPLDVIRSRMYFDSISSNNNNKNKSTWSMMQQMYFENDKRFNIFFRGYGVTILRAGPVAAVVLPVYDKTLEWLLVSRPG
jgi:solute carrier family 25 carnitine/acylcarnitine transporter 20/29